MGANVFSLITCPWIRVRLHDDESRLVSLTEIFSGDVDAVALQGDSPTQDYAVLRVLLSIFIRGNALFSDWDLTDRSDLNDWRREAWQAAVKNEPDSAVLQYLEEYADRFDLFHERTPFMQVPTLRTKDGRQLPVRRLVPEAEQDYFAMRAGAAVDSLSHAEAARWLIHSHAFDYSGIKPGVEGDPRVKGGKSYPVGTGWSGSTGGTTILGATLRETLVLNSPDDVFLNSEGDLPVWERPQDGPDERESTVPTGACDLMTWQTRRVRLHSDGERITGCMLTNGDKIPDAGKNVLDDPMTPYRFSTNKSTKTEDVFYAQPYSPERTVWRSLEPLVALGGDVPLEKKAKPGKRPKNLDWLAGAARRFPQLPTTTPIRLTSMVYGPNAATITETVDAVLDLPVAVLQPDNDYLRSTLIATARTTLDAGILLGRFGGHLLQAAGGDYAFQPQHTESFLSKLEQPFRDWLRTVPTSSAAAFDAGVEQWQTLCAETLLQKARTLVNGAGTKALIGRTLRDGEREIPVSAALAEVRLRRDLAKTLPLATPFAATPTREETQHAR